MMKWHNFRLGLTKAVIHTKCTIMPYRSYLALVFVLAVATPLSIEQAHASSCIDEANDAFDDDLGDLNDWFDGATFGLIPGSPEYNAVLQDYDDEYDDLSADLDDAVTACVIAAVEAARAEIDAAAKEIEKQLDHIPLLPGSNPDTTYNPPAGCSHIHCSKPPPPPTQSSNCPGGLDTCEDGSGSG